MIPSNFYSNFNTINDFLSVIFISWYFTIMTHFPSSSFIHSFISVWTRGFLFLFNGLLAIIIITYFDAQIVQNCIEAAPSSWIRCPCVTSHHPLSNSFLSSATGCPNHISHIPYPSSGTGSLLQGRALVLFSGEQYLDTMPTVLSATGM